MTDPEFLRDLAKQLPRTHPRKRRLEDIADELLDLEDIVDEYRARLRRCNE
jgi:hypothetical protein